MTAGLADVRHREILAVILLLLIAIAVRAVYLLQYKANAPYCTALIVDSYYYDLWAQRVAKGEGYGPMPFYLSPLYPYLLALVYAAFGHKLLLVYVLQSVLGVVNILLVYTLGKRFFGHRAGLAAAALIVMYAPVMYLESKLLTETPAITLNLMSILLLVRALDRPIRRGGLRFLVAGLVLALSALCRPVALIMVALVLAWLLLPGPRRRWGLSTRRLAPLVLGIVLGILPVTARNYFVGKDLVPIASVGGVVFAQGNRPGARGLCDVLPGFTGSILTQQKEEMALAEEALGRPVKPSESSAYWLKKGLRFIRERPGEYLLLLLRKFVWTLHSREAPCNYNIYLETTFVPILRYLPLPFSVLGGFALFGFVAGRRKGIGRESDLVGLYVISVFLSLLVFFITSRYRAPMAPGLAILAGFGLLQTIENLTGRDIRGITLVSMCVVPVLLLSLVPYPIAPITAEAPANLGVSYMSCGRIEEAISEFERSLEINPNFAYAHFNLGLALERQGQIDEAIDHYSLAVQIAPDNAEMQNKLGVALAGQGRLEEAMTRYTEALAIDANYAEAHFNLGAALYEQGKVRDAIREYREAVRIKPNYAEAHLNLGNALDEVGRMDEAMDAYREAIRIKPNLAEAHNNLAVDLYLQGKYGEAWQEVRLCRKHGGKPNPEFLKALAREMPEPVE